MAWATVGLVADDRRLMLALSICAHQVLARLPPATLGDHRRALAATPPGAVNLLAPTRVLYNFSAVMVRCSRWASILVRSAGRLPATVVVAPRRRPRRRQTKTAARQRQAAQAARRAQARLPRAARRRRQGRPAQRAGAGRAGRSTRPGARSTRATPTRSAPSPRSPSWPRRWRWSTRGSSSTGCRPSPRPTSTSRKGGARSRLLEGMTLSNRDLLHAALMGSDNRAIPALGRAVKLSPVAADGGDERQGARSSASRTRASTIRRASRPRTSRRRARPSRCCGR